MVVDADHLTHHGHALVVDFLEHGGARVGLVQQVHELRNQVRAFQLDHGLARAAGHDRQRIAQALEQDGGVVALAADLEGVDGGACGPHPRLRRLPGGPVRGSPRRARRPPGT